jgi:hypothetical protein
MTFMLAVPGAVLPPAAAKPKPKRPVAALGMLWKDYTSPGVYEVVKAVTADSEWLFERAEDGTWETGHLPTETVVKTGLRSLPACRAYAGSGRARADLKQIQAHERGEHETERSVS